MRKNESAFNYNNISCPVILYFLWPFLLLHVVDGSGARLVVDETRESTLEMFPVNCSRFIKIIVFKDLIPTQLIRTGIYRNILVEIALYQIGYT